MYCLLYLKQCFAVGDTKLPSIATIEKSDIELGNPIKINLGFKYAAPNLVVAPDDGSEICYKIESENVKPEKKEGKGKILEFNWRDLGLMDCYGHTAFVDSNDLTKYIAYYDSNGGVAAKIFLGQKYCRFARRQTYSRGRG